VTAVLAGVAGTLRTRGRIYGITVEHVDYHAGFSATLTFLVRADDWPAMRPARGRAPRNDVEIVFTDQIGAEHRCEGARLTATCLSVQGSTMVQTSAILDRTKVVTTFPPVQHRPVCAGCHQPWPCQEAS
jgi:hypothetical protein